MNARWIVDSQVGGVGLRILSAFTLSAAVLAWTIWPDDRALPHADIVVVPATTATSAPVAVVVRPTTTGAPLTLERVMLRDVSNGRIDPALQTLVSNAEPDIRTMHDQIAQQKRTQDDDRRESIVVAALSGLGGVTAVRVICAGTICEVAGRSMDVRAFANEAASDRLARDSMSFGPSAFAPAAEDGQMLFVQYVNVESDLAG